MQVFTGELDLEQFRSTRKLLQSTDTSTLTEISPPAGSASPVLTVPTSELSQSLPANLQAYKSKAAFRVLPAHHACQEMGCGIGAAVLSWSVLVMRPF